MFSLEIVERKILDYFREFTNNTKNNMKFTNDIKNSRKAVGFFVLNIFEGILIRIKIFEAFF